MHPTLISGSRTRALVVTGTVFVFIRVGVLGTHSAACCPLSFWSNAQNAYRYEWHARIAFTVNVHTIIGIKANHTKGFSHGDIRLVSTYFKNGWQILDSDHSNIRQARQLLLCCLPFSIKWSSLSVSADLFKCRPRSLCYVPNWGSTNKG